MIQFNSSMNDLLVKQKLSAETDRAQIKWILAKNRGNSSVVNDDELTLLLDNRRITWNDLSVEDKRRFLAKPHFVEKIEKWQQMLWGGKIEKTDSQQLSGVVADLLGEEIDVTIEGSTIEEKVKILSFAFQRVTKRLLIDWGDYCSEEEWESKSEEVKTSVLNLFQYLFFGLKTSDLKVTIESLYS
jgi:hypothetical protein